MAKPGKKALILSNLKYSVSDAFFGSKKWILITLLLLLVSLLTGIILSVRFNTSFSMSVLQDYGVVAFAGTGVTTSFFARFGSLLLMGVLLFVCSYSKFLTPIAVILLSFRSYLLGFNITILFMSYGFPGILISLFIILPCQLLMLIGLCCFYFLLRSSACTCYGKGGTRQKRNLSLIFAVVLLVICLLETLLLLIFNASAIIVI